MSGEGEQELGELLVEVDHLIAAVQQRDLADPLTEADLAPPDHDEVLDLGEGAVIGAYADGSVVIALRRGGQVFWSFDPGADGAVTYGLVDAAAVEG